MSILKAAATRGKEGRSAAGSAEGWDVTNADKAYADRFVTQTMAGTV